MSTKGKALEAYNGMEPCPRCKTYKRGDHPEIGIICLFCFDMCTQDIEGIEEKIDMYCFVEEANKQRGN